MMHNLDDIVLDTGIVEEPTNGKEQARAVATL